MAWSSLRKSTGGHESNSLLTREARTVGIWRIRLHASLNASGSCAEGHRGRRARLRSRGSVKDDVTIRTGASP